MPDRDVTEDTENTDKTTMVGADRHLIIDSETNPDSLKEITHLNLLAAILTAIGGGLVSGPQSFGDNYVITPSIASNNLTVALKILTGADPSSSGKLYFRIGNTKREVTAALSVTVTAGAASGAGTFNAGAVEFAAKDIQLFVYVGWRVSDSSVFILLSRIPYARTMADFSSTAANEKYGAYSGAAPASTDEVENIGRINVQNSGSASYNWSIPNPLVINRPIYETGELSYTPQWSASGSLTFGTVTNQIASYQIRMNRLFAHVRGSGTLGGTASTSIYYTSPFTPKVTSVGNNLGWMIFSDGSATPGIYGGSFWDNSVSKISNVKYSNAAWHNSGAGIVDSVVDTFI